MLQVPKLYIGSKAIRQINVTAACGGLVKLMLQMLPVAQEATLPCDQSCRMAAACLLLPGLPVQICNVPCVENKCKKKSRDVSFSQCVTGREKRRTLQLLLL